MARANPGAGVKFKQVMSEFHAGKLKMGGTGKPVPASRPDIAQAIAFSAQRKANARKAARSRKRRRKD